MIEVIQAPEIIGTNTVNAVKLTYVIDGVSTTVYLVECGVNYYRHTSDLTWTIDSSLTLSDGSELITITSLNGSWTIAGYDSVTTELVTIQNECIKVTFDSTSYNVQKIGIVSGKNEYFLLKTIDIVFDGSIWYLTLPDAQYTLPTTPDIPISNVWEYQSGTEYATVSTEVFTSKWQAVHHPIKWQVQRKDRLVEEKSIDGGGYVSLLLTELPPAELQVGNLATYYLPNGDKIGSIPITAISGYRIRLLSLIPGVVEGGFVIFDDLYSNYYIETSILDNGTDEISTTRTIPNSDGSAVIDVHRFLKTKALFQNTDAEDGMSGKYKLKFRECYNFTKQPYGALTDFYYWSNSAKQIRDVNGSNMALYVGNLVYPCKFLSVFERPTNFIGYPFSLSYITSGDWTKYLRRVENSSTHTLITHQNGAVNRLSITDTATSVMIEYGTLTLLPPTFTYEGDLTETKQIKINTKCLQNAVCLTWLNTLGGHEYWVFSYNQIYSIDTAVGGTFEPYIQDLENERSNIFDLERFETNKITLGATVDIEDIKGLKTILSSISVEMLTTQGWIGVRPEVGSFKVYETKGTTADIELTIQLPYTNIQSR